VAEGAHLGELDPLGANAQVRAATAQVHAAEAQVAIADDAAHRTGALVQAHSASAMQGTQTAQQRALAEANAVRDRLESGLVRYRAVLTYA
jgi:multidrug resistance efflux pump